MVMGQSSQRANLLQYFFLFEEMRRGPNGDLRAEVNSTDGTSQDDLFYALLG